MKQIKKIGPEEKGESQEHTAANCSGKRTKDGKNAEAGPIRQITRTRADGRGEMHDLTTVGNIERDKKEGIKAEEGQLRRINPHGMRGKT